MATIFELPKKILSHGGDDATSVRTLSETTTGDSDDEQVDEAHYVVLTRMWELAESHGAMLTEHVMSGYVRAMFKCGHVRNTQGFHYEVGTKVRPCWIRNPGVDSCIMLGAVKNFIKPYSAAPLQECLPLQIIVHKQGPTARPKSDLVEKGILSKADSTNVNCTRCLRAEGGYEFKWVHRAWMQAYITAVTKRNDIEQPRWHIDFVDSSLNALGWQNIRPRWAW